MCVWLLLRVFLLFQSESTNVLSADTLNEVACVNGPSDNEISVVTSTAPVRDDFRTQPEVSEEYNNNDLEACAEAFDRNALRDNCFGEINNATEQTFIEVCLQQVAAGGDPEQLVDLYTVYCQAVTGTDECVFEGVMDLCEDDDTEETTTSAPAPGDQNAVGSPMAAVGAGIAVFVIAAIAAVLLFAFIRRRNKKKAEEVSSSILSTSAIAQLYMYFTE